jgi:hypothetical protein
MLHKLSLPDGGCATIPRGLDSTGGELSMKVSHQWTVAIRPTNGEKPRRITKIASLSGDGFSVDVPYHKAKTGHLFKHPVIPDDVAPRFVNWEAAAPFAARDRVRLIYHSDGFAEFSGDKPGRITASRDLVSGEATGLGLFSAPLSRPIFSGPSVAMTVYGIDQFEVAEELDELIVFEPGDFYYRNCTPETANSWMLAIHAFPRSVVPPIRIKQKRSIVAATLESLNGPIGSVLEMVAISLPEEKMFLGLCVNCFKAKLQSDSGWLFSGPGDYTQNRRGHVLMGIYPRTEIPVGEETSLQQKPESPRAYSVRLSPRESAQRASPLPRSKKNRRRN